MVSTKFSISAGATILASRHVLAAPTPPVVALEHYNDENNNFIATGVAVGDWKRDEDDTDFDKRGYWGGYWGPYYGGSAAATSAAAASGGWPYGGSSAASSAAAANGGWWKRDELDEENLDRRWFWGGGYPYWGYGYPYAGSSAASSSSAASGGYGGSAASSAATAADGGWWKRDAGAEDGTAVEKRWYWGAPHWGWWGNYQPGASAGAVAGAGSGGAGAAAGASAGNLGWW